VGKRERLRDLSARHTTPSTMVLLLACLPRSLCAIIKNDTPPFFFSFIDNMAIRTHCYVGLAMVVIASVLIALAAASISTSEELHVSKVVRRPAAATVATFECPNERHLTNRMNARIAYALSMRSKVAARMELVRATD